MPAAFDLATGRISATHAFADDGQFMVIITVTDNDGASGTGTWAVTVNNVAPEAADDFYEMTEDGLLTIDGPGVLANDHDVPADVLQALLVENVQHGTLTLKADGSFTYAPEANFNGPDRFTYQAQDDDGGLSEAATVSLSVQAVNDAPTFIKGSDVAVDEDAGPQTFAGWATGISAGPPDEAGQTLTFELSVDQPGLFSEQPALATDGSLRFTSLKDATGTATVTVVLRDGGGTDLGGSDTSSPQTFTIAIAPVNDPPVPQPFTGTTAEDMPLSGRLVATDVDSDTLTFRAAFGGTAMPDVNTRL